jgi:hypothetical protein
MRLIVLTIVLVDGIVSGAIQSSEGSHLIPPVNELFDDQ